MVIGATRSGTTSLHNYLGRHPEIGMSTHKELNFFYDRPGIEDGPPLRDEIDRARLTDRIPGRWSQGLGWYRSQFDPSLPVRGESSPLYTDPWNSESAERMAGVIPDAKLIYLVRDPVERAISHFRHSVALNLDRRSPDEALSIPDGWYLLASRYAACLEPYLAQFPRERLLIVETSDLGEHGERTMAEVFRFLEVDQSYRARWFTHRFNASSRQRGARWRAFNRVRRLPGWARASQVVPRRARWMVERLTRRAPAEPAPGPSPEVREFLRESLREDASRFRELTGRDFDDWQV